MAACLRSRDKFHSAVKLNTMEIGFLEFTSAKRDAIGEAVPSEAELSGRTVTPMGPRGVERHGEVDVLRWGPGNIL